MTLIQWVSWLHNLARVGDVAVVDYLGHVAEAILGWIAVVRAVRWQKRRRAENLPRRRRR